MSFPHSNNSLKTAINQLKEVVARHQGEQHETNEIVREIESIVVDIERKAGRLSIPLRMEEPVVAPPMPVNTFVAT